VGIHLLALSVILNKGYWSVRLCIPHEKYENDDAFSAITYSTSSAIIK